MSDMDVKSVPGATGTYVALQPNSDGLQEAGNTVPASGKESPAPAAPEADLQALATKLNIQSQSIGRDLRFKVDMANGRSIIQVLDRETGEIIREIPPEEAELSLAGNGNMKIRLLDSRI